MNINFIIFILIIILILIVVNIILFSKQYTNLHLGGAASLLNDQKMLLANDPQMLLKTRPQTLHIIEDSNKLFGNKIPSIEELDILFPKSERTHIYTYEELLKLYEKLLDTQFISIDSEQLLKNYLKINTLKAGGGRRMCIDIDSIILSDKSTLSEEDFNTTYPPIESYSNLEWAFLTKLGSIEHADIYGGRNIYAMQNPRSIEFREANPIIDCKQLYCFIQFLKINKGIKHIVCLQYEDRCIESFCNIASIEFHYIPMTDFEIPKYDKCMEIIAIIEEIKNEPIVFYCGAGWGRSGFILYMIGLYIRCIQTPNLLVSIPIYNNFGCGDPALDWFPNDYPCNYSAYREIFATNLGAKYNSIKLQLLNIVIAQNLYLYHKNEDGSQRTDSYNVFNWAECDPRNAFYTASEMRELMHATTFEGISEDTVQIYYDALKADGSVKLVQIANEEESADTYKDNTIHPPILSFTMFHRDAGHAGLSDNYYGKKTLTPLYFLNAIIYLSYYIDKENNNNILIEYFVEEHPPPTNQYERWLIDWKDEWVGNSNNNDTPKIELTTLEDTGITFPTDTVNGVYIINLFRQISNIRYIHIEIMNIYMSILHMIISIKK